MFKEKIIEILGLLKSANVLGQVERYSLKYVNVIEGDQIQGQIDKVDLELRLGNVTLSDQHVNIQIHDLEGDIVHIMSIVTSANIQLNDGTQKSGVIVDIDSVANIDPKNFNAFVDDLDPVIEELRQANKQRFFGCLKEKTIEEMEPTYD